MLICLEIKCPITYYVTIIHSVSLLYQLFVFLVVLFLVNLQ
jgi:succinate dehydrogenase/fumarate reductase cytochrome b subunit